MDEDLHFYKTLAPYNPAFADFEVKNGEIYQLILTRTEIGELAQGSAIEGFKLANARLPGHYC